MPYVVTAQISHTGIRITSMLFRTRAEAEAYARRTAQERPGSNPRVKQI